MVLVLKESIGSVCEVFGRRVDRVRVWVGWVDRECVEECCRVESSGGIKVSLSKALYVFFSTTAQELAQDSDNACITKHL